MDTYNHYGMNSLPNDNRASQNDVSLYIENFSKKMPSNRYLPNESCRVCGFEKTTGRNFGVITCSTCKAFFRRNGRIGSSLPPCRFGGQCLINERTRRQCPSCRLVKCFAVGMQKDLIRTEEERAARLELVKANRLQRSDKLIRKKPADFNETECSNNKSTTQVLSSNDWIQLTNIRSAYEHFCLYPILRSEEDREEYLNAQPIKCRLKEHSFVNALNTRLLSLVAFFRATIPMFLNGLNINDQQWLVRTNLRYLFLFSSMDLMNISRNQLYFDENRACHNVYLYVYGQDLMKRERNLIQKLNDAIGSDTIISKIMQIILFLSPCLVTNYLPTTSIYQPSLEAILQIIHSQEQYTQVIWTYLIYRYGKPEAHKLFMLIIGQVLQQQIYGVDVDKKLVRTQPFGNLIYSLLTTFSMD
ncbi:unnamed protein product [Rotaria magnacalcarata]|uniref:Nuclear receptor domain-containing protein n=5 Tax=Rotaria magnacalcarata TaxID=392030 RepID=A0A816SKT6_9BILA|nr:unnamed protein product [Rotaria magnacalcarata]CAF1660594.1 unnamed protein product [Rotaria magnacalcarata]CAF2014747.1 unnamed protein product [Rotaria magnacalcarata]CAF2067222.1 unnamed protein product [Rotaria magnacalcarata]CAF2089227.1 unnamed protein product [Rotaria magnacalcarata]